MFARLNIAPAALVLALLPSIALAEPILFVASGPSAASIQTTVDSFRAAVGDPNNANAAGSQPGGRREINWDGGGAGAPATTFPLPMTTFSNRGNVFTTPGTGFEISGQPTPEFGDINPTYPNTFTTFSDPRLFAPLGSNILDVLFTEPGTTDRPALSSGFGAVFTDVDLANTSSLQFFDIDDALLGTWYVPTFNSGLSFLGVYFSDVVVGRVRITVGNSPLGPNDGGAIDVGALDDFVYGEPQVIPEPTTILMLGSGLMGVGAALRRGRRTRRS